MRPVDSAETMDRPHPLLVFSRPRDLFAALRDNPESRLPLRILAVSLAPLPVLFAGVSYPEMEAAISESLTSAGELTSSPGQLAFVLSLVLGGGSLLAIALFLLISFSIFRLLSGFGHPLRLHLAMWAYAMLPVALKSALVAPAVVLFGMERTANGLGALSLFDPFMLASSAFLYVGCRETLRLGRGRSILASFGTVAMFFAAAVAQIALAGSS